MSLRLVHSLLLKVNSEIKFLMIRCPKCWSRKIQLHGLSKYTNVCSSLLEFQTSLTFFTFLAFHYKFLTHNGKYVKNSTRFSAFLNKQFAQIVYTKRLELHLCERESCFENTLSKIYQKPRLYIHSCEE